MAKIYLYKDGKEYNTDITGGLFNNNYSCNYADGTMTLNDNYITFNCIRNGGFLIQSTNLIDFSKYKYLRVKCDAYITNDVSNSQVNISLLSRHYTSWYDTSNWATVLIIQDGLFGQLGEYGEYKNHILTINLENTQNAYMCFYVAGNPKPVNVYEIYLETEDTLSETIKKATKEIILNNKLFQEHVTICQGEES